MYSPKEACLKTTRKGAKCPLGDSTNLSRKFSQHLQTVPATDEAHRTLTKEASQCADQQPLALLQAMLQPSAKQSNLLPNLSLIQSLGISLTFENLANLLLQTSATPLPNPQSASKVEGSADKSVGKESTSQCSSRSKEHISHSQATGVATMTSTKKRMQVLSTHNSKGGSKTVSSDMEKRAHCSRGFTAEKPNLIPENSKTAPRSSRSTSPHTSPRLTQTALQLTADKTVALTTAKVTAANSKKKKKGSPTSGSQRKRHRKGNQPAATHTIPELFRSSGSPTLIQYSHSWSDDQDTCSSKCNSCTVYMIVTVPCSQTLFEVYHVAWE